VCHFFQGTTHGFRGDFDQADAAFDRAHAVARELNQPELDCWVYGFAAHSSRLAGDRERAMERARRAGEAARAAGDPSHLLGMEQRSLYHAHSAAGDGAAAREAAEAFMHVLLEAGTERPMQAEAPALIASAILLCGDVEEALAAAHHAADVATEMGRLETEIVARLTIGQALAAREETAHDPAIETTIERIGWLIEETGARLYGAELCELRGQVAEARGEPEQAEAARQEARRLFTEMNAPRRAARVG
jgi:ATP/maltotriose-dependent transcriptional regulator MalT